MALQFSQTPQGLFFRVFVQTVDALGENPRGGRLAGTSGPAKKIRVAHFAAFNLMFEYSDDMFLPEDFIEHLRPLGTV